MDPNVPLVVPEVNPDAIDHHQGIIASPNCSTTQMVVALKPLHDAARVRRVVVSTYQATSGAGLAGSRELVDSINAGPISTAESHKPADLQPQGIAFENVIPQIGSPKYQGYTSEEMKMVHETRKIMGDDSIQICPTCVRVPVANFAMKRKHPASRPEPQDLRRRSRRRLFAATPGVVVEDDLAAKHYPTPDSCNGRDEVFIGRIREDLSSPTGLAFWCVSDNVRKGAATNAVQIAELLVAKAGSPASRQPRPLLLADTGCPSAGRQQSPAARATAYRDAGRIRMRTIKLTLAYDGTGFAGWQSQRDRRTLQDTLEQTLSEILGHSVRVAASGRTDAGVHALGQVVSFDTESALSPATVLLRGAETPSCRATWRCSKFAKRCQPVFTPARRCPARKALPPT